MSCGVRQVEAAAVSKHSSLEEIEEHRERQQLAKIRQRIAKRTAETQKVGTLKLVQMKLTRLNTAGRSAF